VRTIIACLVSALLAGSIATVATISAAGPPVVHFRATSSLVVDGYGYSCQTTARTPNFACWYGPPNGPESTPSFTVAKGSRKMVVDSALRPVVRRASGGFETDVLALRQARLRSRPARGATG
jgi:hypothetical protein